MKNVVYIATSLDGYIATKDGGIDWLHDVPNPDQSDFGFAAFIEGIDALVMGRNTYEKVLSFGEWPYEKRVFVLSRSLTEVPEHLVGKVEFLEGQPHEIVEGLHQRGFQNLYIDGGKVVQVFLEASLIDEIILTTLPIVLGDGIPLFGKMELSTKLQHLQTEVLNNALVKSHYRVERQG
ncbi:MAG: dihydrofolate reductase [Deltaproteobacteria bacterium]|nr:MAG: dihydrofolate reductase [Deltaproteobacteria bacterium]